MGTRQSKERSVRERQRWSTWLRQGRTSEIGLGVLNCRGKVEQREKRKEAEWCKVREGRHLKEREQGRAGWKRESAWKEGDRKRQEKKGKEFEQEQARCRHD